MAADFQGDSSPLVPRFDSSIMTLMFSTLGFYLLIVYVIGPRFMKHRKPYDLKTFMIFYNIGQVLACIYILHTCFRATGLKIFRFWKCNFYGIRPDSMDLYDSIVHFTFWLKLIELSETIVFVLRKKANQVSYLHVFHHCSTVTLIYVMGNNYRGLIALFPLILNSTVHVMMYTYYLVAAVCDKKTVQRLTPVKKSITITQMIQFVLILTQAITFSFSCTVSKFVIFYYTFCVCVIFYGFYDFYKKAYKSRPNSGSTKEHTKRSQKR